MTDATFSEGTAEGQSLGDKANDAKDALKQKAGAAADQLRSTVTERTAQAREWASDQGDVLRDTVQTRPLVAVGVSAGTAFAAGLVIGILLARR